MEKVKKYKYDVIAVAAISVIVTIFLVWFYQLIGVDLHVPINYTGGDEMSFLATARLTQDSFWNFGTTRLSFPEEYYYNGSEIITGLHNADVFLVKTFMILTGNQVGLAVNLAYFSFFYIIAYCSYFVLRKLSIRPWISVCGSVCYAMLSYIFIRNLGHVVLSAYFFVPLALLMSVWVYEKENFLKPCRGFFRNKENYAGILLAFLVANAGIGYYQVFACFFIAVTVIVALLRDKDTACLKRGITAVGCIVVFVVLAVIPEIITMAAGHIDAEGRGRVMYSESYALNLIQMLFPVNSHGIQFIQNAIDNVENILPEGYVNENWSSYIGLAGVLGFIILFVILLKRGEDKTEFDKRINLLAMLNMAGVLFGITGGLGCILYMGGFYLLRSYNRISVFIAFLCIAALCMVLDRHIKKLKKNAQIVVQIIVSLFFVFSIWEQNPGVEMNYTRLETNWYSDEKFINDIEAECQQDDVVMQLPYCSYPEDNAKNDMSFMSHFIGYIHSQKLRWCYGTMLESDADTWYRETAGLEPEAMVQELRNKSVAGIYINRTGYEQKEWEDLESAFKRITGTEPVISENNQLSFFKIN